MTIDDIKNNLQKYGKEHSCQSFQEFLSKYENSKGTKGFITIGKNSILLPRHPENSELCKFSVKKMISPRTSGGSKVELISPLYLEVKNQKFGYFNFDMSSLDIFRENAISLETKKRSSEKSNNKTQVSSPKSKINPSRLKNKKPKTNHNQYSTRNKETSPYSNSKLGSPKRLPSIERQKNKDKLQSFKKIYKIS